MSSQLNRRKILCYNGHKIPYACEKREGKPVVRIFVDCSKEDKQSICEWKGQILDVQHVSFFEYTSRGDKGVSIWYEEGENCKETVEKIIKKLIVTLAFKRTKHARQNNP